MQVQMIRPLIALIVIILQLLQLSLAVIAQASLIDKGVHNNATINASSSAASSPWLNNKVASCDPRPRPPGCWKRPWICRKGEAPGTRMRCCRNRCVDVSSDVNNCGLCRFRCPFSWQCCRGCCTNTNRSRFNCGRCGNRCPWGVMCTYGMCGYGQPCSRPPKPPQPRPPPGCHCPPKPPKPRPPPGGHCPLRGGDVTAQNFSRPY